MYDATAIVDKSDFFCVEYDTSLYNTCFDQLKKEIWIKF